MDKEKQKIEIKKIMEIQELVDKAKKLIFAAQDIECRTDFPYCEEVEKDKDKRNKSMSDKLWIVRGTLEVIDRQCWTYKRLLNK